jgi:hypothetical protein
VPFSMTLVASHGCTLLKLLHHGISSPTSLGAISLLA